MVLSSRCCGRRDKPDARVRPGARGGAGADDRQLVEAVAGPERQLDLDRGGDPGRRGVAAADERRSGEQRLVVGIRAGKRGDRLRGRQGRRRVGRPVEQIDGPHPVASGDRPRRRIGQPGEPARRPRQREAEAEHRAHRTGIVEERERHRDVAAGLAVEPGGGLDHRVDPTDREILLDRRQRPRSRRIEPTGGEPQAAGIRCGGPGQTVQNVEMAAHRRDVDGHDVHDASPSPQAARWRWCHAQPGW